MPRRYPTLYQQRTLWNAATGLSIVLLTAILVGLVWLSGKIFGYLQPVLVPLAVAGIIAYLLDPLVTWMQSKGLSRLRAVIVTFCGFIIALCLAGLLILPHVAEQLGKLASDTESSDQTIEEVVKEARKNPVINSVAGFVLAPHDEHLAEFENYWDTAEEDRPAVPIAKTRIGVWTTANFNFIRSTVFDVTKAGSGKVLSIFGYLIGFAMIPIYLYYFLKESSAIKAHWHNYVPLRASKFKDEVVDCLGEINGYILAFFRGQVLVAFIDGVLIGIALMIFQVPYALVIGLAMAVLGVIPFIGNILCLIPACIIAYVHFSGPTPNHQWVGESPWAYVGVVAAIFLVAQQINSLVTAPKIVGDSVGLHPMTVIFSMLFWSIPLGGFLGALLAVPLTAAIKVLIRRYVWQRRIMEEPPSADSEALA